MPAPKPGEAKSVFLKRAIPMLCESYGDEQRAIAECYSMWNIYHGITEEFVIDEHDTNLLIEGSVLPKVSSGLLKAVKKYHSIKDKMILGAGAALGPGGLAAASAKVGKDKLQRAVIGAIAGKVIQDIQNKKPSTIYDRVKPIPANLAASDTANGANKIQIKPQGIVIQDTYNNPIFPIPEPRLDTAKFNLPIIKYHYKNIYTKSTVDFLPWHYCIEIIDGQYYFFSTRPLDMRYPVRTTEAENLISDNGIELNNTTQKFLQNKPFDLTDAIHICIIGDSSKDVYVDRLYEMIGRLCSGPILRYWKMPTKTGQRVVDFNIGNKFHMGKLDLYLTR